MIRTIVFFLLLIPYIASAATLEDIRSQDVLRCGVSTGQEGFSKPDSRGIWHGFDVDICKAIAIALFGLETNLFINDDDLGEELVDAVEFVPLLPSERILSLKENKIDVLTAKVPVSSFSEYTLGLSFPAITFYDGQGFLVRKSLRVNNAWRMPDNTSVCFLNKSVRQFRIENFFGKLNIKIKRVVVNDIGAMVTAFDNKKCDVISDYISSLADLRLDLNEPNTAYLLPQLISRRPLGLAITNDDPELNRFIKFVVHALIEAEYLGINSYNATTIEKTGNSMQKKFLAIGADERFKLDYLDEDWIKNVIAKVGNYEEIFQRNLGEGSPINLERSINKSWFLGGLLFIPPMTFYEEQSVDPLVDLQDFQFLFDDIVKFQDFVTPEVMKREN